MALAKDASRGLSIPVVPINVANDAASEEMELAREALLVMPTEEAKDADIDDRVLASEASSTLVAAIDWGVPVLLILAIASENEAIISADSSWKTLKLVFILSFSLYSLKVKYQ